MVLKKKFLWYVAICKNNVGMFSIIYASYLHRIRDFLVYKVSFPVGSDEAKIYLKKHLVILSADAVDSDVADMDLMEE